MPQTPPDQLHGKVLALQALLKALADTHPNGELLRTHFSAEVRAIETKLMLAQASSTTAEAFRSAIQDLGIKPRSPVSTLKPQTD